MLKSKTLNIDNFIFRDLHPRIKIGTASDGYAGWLGQVYVIEHESKIIGVVGYHVDKYETNHYWLGWFYVHVDYSRKGYGRHLIYFIKKELRNKGVENLFVNTSSYKFYKKALLFYIELGFKLEAIIKDYYGKNEDQLILSTNL